MFGRKQAGLTLVELLISVVILAILMVVIGPIFSNALTFMESAKRSEVQLNNQKLAAGMLSYARNNGGKLPSERPSEKYALYNKDASTGGDYDLYLELTGTGVPPNQINTTGYGVDAVKLYQKVSGLTHTQPMFFNTGTNVILNYEVAVIYQTRCPQSGACANAALGSGLGDSPRLTAANISSWDVKGDDYAPVMINTLSEQKAMLRVTIGRLNRLSDRISSHFYAKARASESGNENHFAGSITSGAASQGCMVGWDNLSTSNTLQSIGLQKNEYAYTAWGGVIEYCRNYKPVGGVKDEAPFYAALRINRDLKQSSNPSSTNVNSNVFFTF